MLHKKYIRRILYYRWARIKSGDAGMFLLFLMVSGILWISNKLSYEYTTEVVCQVQLSNPPNNMMLTDDSPQTIQVLVRTNGYNILRKRWLSAQVSVVDLSTMTFDKGADDYEQLPTAQLSSVLTKDFGSHCEIKSISPRILEFQLSQVGYKRVPVIPNLRISFAPQFMQRGTLTITPDSVTIKGASSVLDTTYYIHTQRAVYERLSAPVNYTGALVVPHGLLASQQEASIAIDVQRFTQTDLLLPIRCINIPDSTIQVALYPSQATVSLAVVNADYSELARQELELFVDYNEISNSISGTLRLHFDQPHYALSYTINPAFVSFVVQVAGTSPNHP